MELKNLITLFGKWVLFTLLFTVCFILGTMISGLANVDANQAGSSDSSGFSWLLVNSAITVGLLAWPTVRTSWSRWQSIATIFVLLFFIGTLLPQLESLFFNAPLGLNAGKVGTIILSGAIGALLYVPVSVWAFHRNKKSGSGPEVGVLHSIPFKKIGLLSVIYLIVYYLFGYFIAWQSVDLREFYSGTTDILPFWEHLSSTWSSSPGLFGLQIIRGLIWATLAFLLGSMIKNSRNWEKVLIISLSFSLIGTFLLLLPNPFMPEVVRKVHFVELLSSNFLFGLIAGWVLFVWKKKPKVNSKTIQPRPA